MIEKFPIYQPEIGWCVFRVQLNDVHANACIGNGIQAPPRGMVSGRFGLKEVSVAYMADCPRGALLESLFRKDTEFVTKDKIGARKISKFSTKRRISLLDLRGVERVLPFLHSSKLSLTRELAEKAFEEGLDGVIWNSHQHPGKECLAIFEPAWDSLFWEGDAKILSSKSGEKLLAECSLISGVPII